MCRMLAYDGDLNSKEYQEILASFAILGENGCVPCGIEKGHLDGWGIHSSDTKDSIYFRSINSVDKKNLLNKANQLNNDYGQTVVHLRKATVGKNAICNTHPFMRAGISFSHNGSIHAFPNSTFISDRHFREGHTDSETFFMRIIDRINGQIGDSSLDNIKNALLEEIEEIKNISEWTSLTCLIKSPNGIIINYLWNEKHPDVEKLKLNEYYTFYIGKKENITVTSSEILNIDGFIWEKLNNNTVLVLPFKIDNELSRS